MTTEFNSHYKQTPDSDSAFSGDSGYMQPPTPETSAATTPAALAASPDLTQALYLTEPGDLTAISVNDINQGQLGDCFLLASIGEEALFHPTSISNMIHANANGTETVSLYVDQNRGLPNFTSTSFGSIAVTVDNSFPSDAVNNGATQDVVGNEKEIWPQVLEKAVATLDGGYSVITGGGNPMIAMEELTGQKATDIAPAALTLASLENDIGLGDLITMDTSTSAGLPYGLVSDHAYMFEKLSGTGSSAMVQLGNPWGFDQPAAIPLVQLARSGITEVDIGHIG